MLLFLQIAGGTTLGLLVALVIVEYFEEIVLTGLLLLGLGIPMVWVVTYLEGNATIIQKIASAIKPLV